MMSRATCPVVKPRPGRGLRIIRCVVVLAVMVVAGTRVHLGAQAAQTGFPERWIDGTSSTEPQVQVHRYDKDSFILRQSVRTQFEAPFMYLLFGADRALLLDTGAGNISIRQVVDSVMDQWLREERKASLPLVVAHSHAHWDHRAGDDQFRNRPRTSLVGPATEDVQEFFKIESWPDRIVPFELGGRIVDVIPAPGHERSHIVLFDRRTRLLLTGDTLYPGRLYFRPQDFEAYGRSVDRVVEFTKSRNVSWILGAHIEMSRTAGGDFPIGAPVHPNEHRLQLPYAALLQLQQVVHQLGNEPRRVVRDDFILNPTE